jgi:uncharacterized protein YjbJ (UPF0337 family)
MAKTTRRGKAEGGLEKVGGRILEAFSKLTGNHSAGAKGKATRGRGSAKSTKGKIKRRAK